MLAESGRYLVEDIDPAASGKVIPGGELLIFPLRLENVSGSPCRVAVRYS
jgi:kynurenine formamidase